MSLISVDFEYQKAIRFMSHAPNNDLNLYADLGSEGIKKIVKAFYLQIPHDDILGPMYPLHELGPAEERLASFLIYRFGGPDTYIQERGAPRLRMRHAPFRITQSSRDRWIELMNNAIKECKVSDEVANSMTQFFQEAATFLINANVD